MDGKAVAWDGKTPFELAGLGVAAICVGEADFAAYERPYPALCKQGEDHLAKVKLQEELRKCPEEAENYFLRIKVPDIALSYENSMVLDLYDNRFVLGEVMEDGSFKQLGCCSKIFVKNFSNLLFKGGQLIFSQFRLSPLR